ncbi:hypothetical protein ACLMAJ_21460 [Nocardia sp. KC 131]|uniref:hypothetical protein n=1 Tax=Nocardia arseniciresistens TaxID=3392119 RepID=UPI00398F43E8
MLYITRSAAEKHNDAIFAELERAEGSAQSPRAGHPRVSPCRRRRDMINKGRLGGWRPSCARFEP